MLKLPKIPGPSHPITVDKLPGRVVVTVGGEVVAETHDALSLQESTYPPVVYVPREDVDLSQLERTDHETHCPYKGDANYYSIKPGGRRSVNAAWTYEQPYDAVAPIRDHLAFYPDRVDSIEVIPTA